MLHARIAASTLSRRDNFFIQQASVYDKVALALDAVSIVVGIVLIVLAIVALARAGGHRLPFVVLLFGTLCYLISHTLDMAARLLAYDESTFEDGQLEFLAITVAGPALAVFTDIAALLAATLVLWNRQSSLAFAHPAEKPNILKRLLDGGLIGLLVILNVAKQAFIGDALQKIAKGLITESTYLKRYKTSLNMTHAYSVFYFAAVVNIIVTAGLLRSKILRVGAKQGDKPVSTILFVLSPLLLVHWFWYLFEGSWYAARAEGFTETPDYIVMDVSVAEYMLSPAVIALILIVLGIRRTIWNTFGDQPLAGRPTFYPQQQQQQYYYPQQQQSVYGQQAVYGQQPAYAQQPVYGHPVAMQQTAPGQSVASSPAGQQAQWQPEQLYGQAQPQTASPQHPVQP